MPAVNYLFAAAIGMLLGAAELISRYRDRPRRLAGQSAAWVYLAISAAAASAAALLLIDRFDWDFGQSSGSLRTTHVLVAGLGSAVLFRSSLFILKVGDENVGMGPSYVLTSLLGAADRSVDRDQAGERLRAAGEDMAAVDFSKAKVTLVSACLAAAANVSADDSARLRTAVDALSAAASIPESAKSLVLGMLIIDTVGAEVLSQAVESLGDSIK